jgi:hypothetical protein
MGKILAILGLIIIAPFALIAAFTVLALIWVLLLFSIKIVFVVGGALFVVVFVFWMLAIMVDGYKGEVT